MAKQLNHWLITTSNNGMKSALDVKYTTGRLIDFQAFYDKLKNDDPEIDVYQGAWGTGSDPSPTGLLWTKLSI